MLATPPADYLRGLLVGRSLVEFALRYCQVLIELAKPRQICPNRIQGRHSAVRKQLDAAVHDIGGTRQSYHQAGKADAGKLSSQLDLEKEATARAVAQIEILNTQISALRRQIAALEEALGASEKKEKESQLRIADLGQRLNVTLAQRVQELSPYRSDFFGKLREILGNRPDIRVVGDRFVFQSEVFFDSGAAVVRREGRSELDQLATALLDLDTKIPSELNWVLRVDGHTDTRPIAASPFKSKWELSAARAISVVHIWSAKVSRRSGWWRQALASSSRSIPATPRKPSAAIAESS